MAMVFSDAELTLLAETLRSDLGEVHTEIAHTDSRDYRESLKRRRELLEAILGKVEQEAANTGVCR